MGKVKYYRLFKFCFFLLLFVLPLSLLLSFDLQEEEYEEINSDSCEMCHDKSKNNTVISEDLSHSIHEMLECLDCHQDKGTIPHRKDSDFILGSQNCRGCHDKQSEEYTAHGRARVGEYADMPSCSDCHGDHNILPSDVKHSKTNPLNLPQTCESCHENLNITSKFEALIDHPVKIYESSVHGQANINGSEEAATCRNCHATDDTSHKIYASVYPDSSINHFNIPETCGQCHESETEEYLQGIHGELLKQGEMDTPVCTHCHGEHGIISPSDPRSPVSKNRLAQATCEPCHESIALREKYGLSLQRKSSFIDSYHGLKTKAGDLFVANCASCHGVHKILPSSDPESMINPQNLQKTCGECHRGISPALAATAIHGIGIEKSKSDLEVIIRNIYIFLIIGVIGFMAFHWIIHLIRQVIVVMKKPQVRRMRTGELWQHYMLMISFIILVITGFSLRSNESWITRLFFGYKYGFSVRGILHRAAAVALIIATGWHVVYLFTQRGRQFFKDMIPKMKDIKDLFQFFLYNFGLSKKKPLFERFGYVEKAEYWALIWGNIVMIFTGLLLWFDNFFVNIFPQKLLEIALVIHFYEAILASLAILVWHLYSTVFNPEVYPMNTSWLNGKMPRDMYEHEHPLADIEED